MGPLARLLLGVLTALLLHTPARADEAAVRAASDALVQAWNRGDGAAWAALLTDDAWYSPTPPRYGAGSNRDTLPGYFDTTARDRHLDWRIVQVRPLAAGSFGVVLVQTASMRPNTGDSDAMRFTSDPCYARWRREPDGRWRLAYFTSDKGSALAEMQNDEAPASGAGAATASGAAALTPTPARAFPPRVAGQPPAEYTAFWGRLGQGCNVCHARPPALPSSTNASGIVAAGAAAATAAALRQAMAPRPGFTEQMAPLIADPALNDEVLEALRRYLVDVRDGAAAATLGFDAPGAARLPCTHRDTRSRHDSGRSFQAPGQRDTSEAAPVPGSCAGRSRRTRPGGGAAVPQANNQSTLPRPVQARCARIPPAEARARGRAARSSRVARPANRGRRP